MSHSASLPLKTRALNALCSEDHDEDVCSVLSESGRFLLLADTPNADKGAELFVEFPDAENVPSDLALETALYSKNVELLEGVWTTKIVVDGEELKPEGAWITLCESFEKDYAFCERSVKLSGGRLLSRKLFFAYHESLLLFFDEIDGTSADRENAPKWEYETIVPIAESLSVGEDDEARETTLKRRIDNEAQSKSDPGRAQKKDRSKIKSEADLFLVDLYDADDEEEETPAFETLARVFPFNLSEWRADVSQGDFKTRQNPSAFVLTATREGGSITSSLLIDLNARRAERRCTWRPLTVGESMEVCDEDSAVGRKIKLGQEQYVLYASTSPAPAIRSILSRNLLSDFMFGKFTASRGVEPIVDVDIEDEE